MAQPSRSPGKILRGLGQGDGAGMALPPLGNGKMMGKGSEMLTGWSRLWPWNWHFYASLLLTAAFGMSLSRNSCRAPRADLDSHVPHKMGLNSPIWADLQDLNPFMLSLPRGLSPPASFQRVPASPASKPHHCPRCWFLNPIQFCQIY